MLKHSRKNTGTEALPDDSSGATFPAFDEPPPILLYCWLGITIFIFNSMFVYLTMYLQKNMIWKMVRWQNIIGKRENKTILSSGE